MNNESERTMYISFSLELQDELYEKLEGLEKRYGVPKELLLKHMLPVAISEYLSNKPSKPKKVNNPLDNSSRYTQAELLFPEDPDGEIGIKN